jgi:ArsR family transcriptional regulator
VTTAGRGTLDRTNEFDDHGTVTTRVPLRPALTAKQFELISKALADPRRMAVLEAIGSEEECPCQLLRQRFPISKATISHHIKELVGAGLIEARREGQFLNCEVRRETLEAYAAELLRRAGSK